LYRGLIPFLDKKRRKIIFIVILFLGIRKDKVLQFCGVFLILILALTPDHGIFQFGQSCRLKMTG
jgi:hypothetical protein